MTSTFPPPQNHMTPYPPRMVYFRRKNKTLLFLIVQLNSTSTGWDILTLQCQMEDKEEKDELEGISCSDFLNNELIFENTPAGGAKGIFWNKYMNLGKIFIFNIFILPINKIGKDNHLSRSLDVDSIITL